MNKLSIERQAQIIKVLCEGNSIRSTARITGASINTVVTLLQHVGTACWEYQDKNVRNLTSKLIQCDEIWSFCYSKQNNIPEEKRGQFGYGDVWTFVAIDAETKLVISWLVGNRDVEAAYEFAYDVKRRISNRVQLTTDGHQMYYEAIKDAFGYDIDYAMLVKRYHNTYDEFGRSVGFPTCTGAKPKRIRGNPDMNKVSTSFIERQNLTMRMCMRRFTRSTNGFSKKVENHMLAVALHFMYYNFVKTHKTLANPYPRTPAMAAGISNHIWDTIEIVKLILPSIQP